jgi:hypothetical protein
MRTTQLAQRMLALFVAGALLLNYPLLRLALSGGAEAPATLLGLPRLPLLLFAGWALLIVLLALLMERGGDEPASDTDASGPP